ncbi:hypothetical protein CRENBAI_020644 [Crenichthys baileyi]|uniref:Extensin-like n=1 Tax=Crenichthys baileyi TaxID=28760 RepID=A0AAV9RUB6_9TELE
MQTLCPPPPDRTGTGVRNQNPDKEPESKPEPPRSKRCPSPPRANHPPPPQKKTYTHPNIRTTPRTHKTLDAQILGPASRVHSFKERAPGDIPAWTQAPRPNQDPSLRDDTPQEPRAPKPIPYPPRCSPATRPVTFVRRHRHRLFRLPSESHQSPTPVGATATGARPSSDPSPGTPQMPQTQTSSTMPHRTKPKVPHPY